MLSDIIDESKVLSWFFFYTCTALQEAKITYPHKTDVTCLLPVDLNYSAG